MVSQKRQFALAIDLGSGGPKVALVSDEGQIVANDRGYTKTIVLGPGAVEQDPADWWRAVGDAVRSVLAQGAAPVEQIKAICCAGQWSVTTPVDARGLHLSNAIHWLDARGAPHSRAITSGFPAFSGYGLRKLLAWIRISGAVPVHSGADALSHILFLRNERPDIYRQAAKLLEPVDYLNLRLTGRAAAAFGSVFCYALADTRDNLRVDYHPRLLSWSGVDRHKLPDLVPPDHVLGPILPEVAAQWGLSTETQVVAGLCDSQAAILGSGAVGDRQLHCCVGTSSWITGHVPFKRTDLGSFLSTMPAGVRGKNLVVAELGPAGKCVEYLADNWLFSAKQQTEIPPGERYGQTIDLAQQAPLGSGGVLFLPWLAGSGPPTADSAARGALMNLSLESNRAHAARAVLEGVAFNLRWLLTSVERFVGQRQEFLPFIGGGARSPLWCQILADVFDRPVQQMAEPSFAICRGAGLAAFLALGVRKLEEIPALVAVERTFTPEADGAARYAPLFERFVNLYKANRRLFQAWNGAHPK